jgi:thymidylate synthase
VDAIREPYRVGASASRPIAPSPASSNVSTSPKTAGSSGTRSHRRRFAKAYHDIVREVLQTGTRKENRTGVDTISTFHHSYEIDLAGGFPLLTTKQISWKNIVVELLWFLSGRTDIGFLKKHGCKFWDSWANHETGEVPSAYGNFWRHFPVHVPRETTVRGYEPGFNDQIAWVVGGYEPGFNDQIAWVVGELKKSPMSRRLVVSAWAPGNAQTSKLPPCHMQFILNVQHTLNLVDRISMEAAASGFDDRRTTPRLCLHMTQRSCDVALGVPYNIASYALLIHLFSRFSGIEPGIFAHTLVDAHIYTKKPDGTMADYDHIPGLEEQLGRVPRPLPRLVLSDRIVNLDSIATLLAEDLSTEELMKHFRLVGYDPHPAISFKVAV